MSQCPHPRQVYFDQTLPCSRPDCHAFEKRAFIGYGRDVFEFNQCRRSVVKVVFRTDGGRWIPERCIVRGVDQNMDHDMDAAGLSGAFVD